MEQEKVDQVEASEEVKSEVIEPSEATEDAATETVNEESAPEKDDLSIPENAPEEVKKLKDNLIRAWNDKVKTVAEDRKQLQTKLSEVESIKQKAELLDTISANPRFRDWAEKERKIASGESIKEDIKKLSPEDLEEIRNDPEKFSKFLDDIVEYKMASKMGGVSKATEEIAQLKEMLAVKEEYNTTSAKYSDFSDLKEAGILDKYIDKGYSYEDSYKLFKFESTNGDSAMVEKKATELINKSKLGTTEKPGGVPKTTGRVIKPRGFDEAFDEAFDMIMKGQKPKFSKD